MAAATDPLYRHIMQRIREDLFPDGTDGAVRLPSERALQERYKVSRPTISKALAALAAEGVVTKRERSGNYRADEGVPVRGGDGRGRLPVIGYVAPLTGEELVQRAFHGVDRVANRRGYRVIMGNAGTDWHGERAAVHDLIASGVVGLIITPCPRTTDQAVQDYLRSESFPVPVVAMDTCVPEQTVPQVVFDNVRGGYDVTNWLIQQGHTRIAILTFADVVIHGPLRGRLQGYQDALADHGITPDAALIERVDSCLDCASAVTEALDRWETLAHPPTAVIAVDDVYAMTVIEQLEARGYAVPDDMAVVGFDNRSVARRFRPAFPSTDPDFERMGEIGCEMLLNAIATGEQRLERRVLALPLITERHPPHHPVRRPPPSLPRRQAALTLAGT
jgi:DNA-binding LacI/PurR family transcriptional regulator